LVQAASEPVEIDGKPVSVSASVGATVYSGESSIDADQLVRQADQAMYAAKLAGKNRYHIDMSEITVG